MQRGLIPGGSFFPSDYLSFALIDESQTVLRLTLLRQVNLEKVKFNRRPTNSAKIKKCGVSGQSPCFQYGPALSLLVMKTINCTKNCLRAIAGSIITELPQKLPTMSILYQSFTRKCRKAPAPWPDE